jgi:sterol desaturase/sphingolipid hydroxylase (fatty acid hydroxylase superfamily)
VTALLLGTVASFAALAIVFGLLERAFPARRGQAIFRRAFLVDATFFAGQYLLFAGLTTSLLATVAAGLGALGFSLASFAAALPLWSRVLIALVLGDVIVYWFHRACHHFDFLWRFHAVHHSVEELDWLAAHREHPLDGMATQLCLNLPGILLGLPFEALGALIALRGLWAIFIHSNVHLPVGPLRYLLGAPELHHWHHARVERTTHNFANVAPWIDIVFGTYHRPEGEERYRLGVVGEWPRGYAAQLWHPFARLSRSTDSRRSAHSPGSLAERP